VTGHRTTVLVPLHRAAEWHDRVLGTVRELADVADVIVSDADTVDDTLERLSRELHGLPGVQLLGRRTLAPGWVAHCNDLQQRASTSFIMWMPQDDRVEPEWITLGERALDARPEAVIAVGSMVLEYDDGTTEVLPPIDDYAQDSAVDRVRSALQRQFFTGPPGLGHAYRGVQRAAASIPLPRFSVDGIDPESGWKADVLWAMRLLSHGPFEPIAATYRKTVHSASASGRWEGENLVRGFRRNLVDALDGLSPDDRLALIAEIWDDEASRLRRRVKTLEKRERARRDSNSQPSDP